MSTFTGARQRKGGAERRENDNQSGASKAANGAVHAEIVPGGKAGRCWLAFKGTCGLMILFGLVVFFGGGCHPPVRHHEDTLMRGLLSNEVCILLGSE